MKPFRKLIIAVLAAIAVQSVCYCAPVKLADLPQAFRDTIVREAGDFNVRSVNTRMSGGQTVYAVSARGPENRGLSMTFDESGKLLNKVYAHQLSVKDGRICREGRPITVQSFYTPEGGNPKNAPDNIVHAVSKFSYVGGNLLVFDLYGLSKDGREISEEAKKYYRTSISRLLYTGISGIIRVFNKKTPKDLNYRYNAIRTVSKFFKNDNQFIFWVDGPNAEMLGQALKKMAPLLTVAAPGQDLMILDAKEEAPTNQPVIKLYKSVKGPLPEGDFLLTDRKANYRVFDAAKALPEENEPWVPDNSGLSQEEVKEGFVALFDGKTTNGWLPVSRNSPGFVVKDGTIQRQPRGGTIRTVKRFDDFILRLDFQIEKNGNSGVQVRCPRANRASKIGFEMQILGDYGKEPTPDCTGAVYNVIAPTVNASKPAGEWNSCEITCDGSKVKIVLNGTMVQDLDFDDYGELRYRLRDGFIFLTDHGSRVSYRNIRIKEL